MQRTLDAIEPVISYSLPVLVGAMAYNMIDTEMYDSFVQSPELYMAYRTTKSWAKAVGMGLITGFVMYNPFIERMKNPKLNFYEAEERARKKAVRRGLIVAFGFNLLSVGALEAEKGAISKYLEEQKTEEMSEQAEKISDAKTLHINNAATLKAA